MRVLQSEDGIKKRWQGFRMQYEAYLFTAKDN